MTVPTSNMNACEEEILRVTRYKPRQKYKNRQEYLAYLLAEVDALTHDKLEWLISHQVYAWYRKAASAFKLYRPLPELPNVPGEELRYRRDDEPPWVPPETPELTDEERRVTIKELLEVQEEADRVLRRLEELTTKLRYVTRKTKYRVAEPLEGARWYLFPEFDRFGFLMGSKRQKVVEMFERGVRMTEVTKAFGYHFYELLSLLRQGGHRIINIGGLIKLTHKDDLEVK